jgi:hypothetical protein
VSIILLPNNVWAAAAQTDITNVAGASYASEAATFEAIAGGPRSLSYSSTDTDARKFVYINKAGTLNYTHVIWARADLHNNASRGVQINSYSTFPSAGATEFSTGAFSQTLIGKNSQDWVFPVSGSGKQGIELSLTTFGYTKNVVKFFVSNGITLPNSQQVVTTHLPYLARYTYRRQTYLIDEEWQFTFLEVTKAEVDAFESIPNLLSEPMFVYDTLGTQIPYSLIHGIITDHKVTAVYDDNHTVTFTMDALRQWA